ncbi:hypothetical protein E3P86_00900 [Wallemia ichthyophaga]|uniref:choline-phosphate cytidylyltransferase n=1 Tax=Wallemia ichthyophaga TaxID=245174 RepID=A0A4T0JAI9_WALIC|nr:hypothetical protein E3P86_00900 [Wallemia ichthyophaga]
MNINRKRGEPEAIISSSRDGSEEDNDLDPLSSSDYEALPKQHQQQQLKTDEHEQFKNVQSQSKKATDSQTYDGDVESSATANIDSGTPPAAPLTKHVDQFADQSTSNFTPQSIQSYVKSFLTIDPPSDRPIRIYADGVYDLFHVGHSLQLRQAKLSFENVELIVGVCSAQTCQSHKSKPVMSDFERTESVRNSRWVDEVIEDAPWVINQAFLDHHKIDFVAHDGEPYVAQGHEDVYTFVKAQGRFIPTRRTNGISTSDLLARILRQYKSGQFDKKLIKIDQPELCSTSR